MIREQEILAAETRLQAIRDELDKTRSPSLMDALELREQIAYDAMIELKDLVDQCFSLGCRNTVPKHLAYCPTHQDGDGS